MIFWKIIKTIVTWKHRSTLKRINISLNQPKADECEDCLTFQLDPLILEEESDVFIAYTIHKNKANQAN